MINIRVLPIWGMEDEDFGDKLVISIVSPYVEHPKVKGNKVYKFHFHDITEEYFLSTTHRLMQPMGKEIAESIAEIAIDNRDCEEWVIHCEAGISRSPAVAIGLASVIDTNPSVGALKKLFPSYNKHVEALVREAVKAKVDTIMDQLKAADIGG